MRKYYLFQIRKDFFKIYKNNSYVLYKTLENLKTMKSKDFSYGLSLYESLCQTFDVLLLNRYLKNKYYGKIHSQKNRHIITNPRNKNYILIEIHYSCIIILTNTNLPNIMREFNYYSHYIFVCDFMNEDFFWLDNQYKKR